MEHLKKLLIAKNIIGKMNSRCYLNSFKHSKKEESDIFVGFAVDANLFYFRGDVSAVAHFWNVKEGQIIDTSLGSDRKYIYFGKKVEKKYTSSTKMWDSELKPLMVNLGRITSFDMIPKDFKQLNSFYKNDFELCEEN